VLRTFIETVRNLDMRLKVVVDGRTDHCMVPAEEMKAMGFVRDFLF
jgi:hypothetical protein